MNIKNKVGVTLTVLVITIIVMLILFGITFSTSTDLLKNSQRNKMKTMLYMVQSRAEILLDDYLFENDGKDLTTISNTDIENSLGGKGVDTSKQGTKYITSVNDLKTVGFETGNTEMPAKNKKIYCSWNENVLLSQGIDTKNLAKGDTIVIQFDIENNAVDVASTKGFSNNGVGIHKLSEFKAGN